MAQILKPPIRLSQNEIDCILIKEKAKWRNFRIQQVRAQANEEAFRVREAGRKEEESQKERIKKEEKAKWKAENKGKIDSLQKKLQNDLQDIGIGHQGAKIENEALQAFKSRRKNDDIVASKRGRKALLTLDKEKSLVTETQNATRMTKIRVTQKEKKRAARISKLPTPVKFKAQKKTNLKPPKKVMFHEAGTFTTSSYVPSKVKIIKEGKFDEVSGIAAAQRENEKYEEMKALKQKEEEENRRKIEERGRLAIKREKAKEMYSDLMKELNDAEENQELSDYLKGDDNLDSLAIENYLRREREASASAAEEKAKRLLTEDLDTIPVKLGTDSSKEEETESSTEKSFNIGAEGFSSDKSVSVQDEVDNTQPQVDKIKPRVDNIQPRVKSPLLQSRDIHLKETVPVHEIPIVTEKFLVRVPLSDQSQSISSQSSEKSKSLRSESSFEEHKIKSKLSSSSEVSFPENLSIGEKTESDAATSHHKLPQKSNTNLIPKGKLHSKVHISPASSSGITNYLKPPPTVKDSESYNDIWKNLKDINELNMKFDCIFMKLRKKESKSPTSTKTSEEDLSSFKTPPKIYTETLKDDGIGIKPVSKREKFEYNKKKVVEIYMRRLLNMKEEECKEISASTVQGSGISVSSSDSNLIELLQVTNLTSSDSTLSTTPTITSNLLNQLSKISFSPSDISTPISTSLDAVAGDHKIPSLGTSGFTSHRTDSENASSSMINIDRKFRTGDSDNISTSMTDSDKKKQILMRLAKLQRIEECLRKKIPFQNQNISTGENQKSIQKSLSYNEIIAETSGSSSDRGSNNYETPPREISTQSWSEFSDFPSRQQQPQQQRDASDDVLIEKNLKEPLRLGEYNDSVESFSDISKTQSSNYHDDYSQYVSLKKEIKALVDSGQKLKATMETNTISNGEYSQVSLVPVSQRDSSSSFSSLPDMEQVIRRIGLGWVRSMATKMDKAEEVKTSDYSE